MSRLWKTLSQHIVAPTQLNLEQIPGLLVPFRRSAAIRRHAAAVIIARVQFISALFALLVPLWSLVDLWVFDGATAWSLVGLRFVSAAVFVILAWPRELSSIRPYAQAMTMLLCMLLVPPLFYLGSVQIIDASALDPWQQLVVRLYAFMPTIVLGGLAIFPLTALEMLLFSLPVLAAAGIGAVASGAELALEQQGAMLWFMLMMMGVAMFSGMSQSHYMESLVQKAMTDPLTGAFSRRSGAEALELMFRLAVMAGKPLTVMFLDLDRFKAINDGYGHDAGDEALRTLVAHLRRTLRRGDVLVRWGGEEFLVILPEMPADQLPSFLARLRDGGLGLRPDGAALSASIGIAECLADGADDWQKLVSIADQRMYAAKQGGRDRAVLPDGTMLALGFSTAAG
ncbi:GGDEF domain-containing protein [Thauera aromatica]|uniref:diguanylate cyclase n=1 Tax=Thauera aromatica K172 TaxID=44139 RepID=A0A2R4BRE4_THAAR|nr:GGDEF domain-containing protein [Thauera aromatica]AVR89916.1 diguanylate cyclase [Thauera aromatica K172]